MLTFFVTNSQSSAVLLFERKGGRGREIPGDCDDGDGDNVGSSAVVGVELRDEGEGGIDSVCGSAAAEIVDISPTASHRIACHSYGKSSRV